MRIIGGQDMTRKFKQRLIKEKVINTHNYIYVLKALEQYSDGSGLYQAHVYEQYDRDDIEERLTDHEPINLINFIYWLNSRPGGYEGRRTGMIYRVAFTGRGAEYTRCFTSKEERDRFAESMRQAGYKVHTWE